jgi:hypothetical protein
MPLSLFLYLWGRGYKECKRVSYNIDLNQYYISTCLFYIYFYRYNYLCIGEHVVVFWSLSDGGLSRNRLLLKHSKFVWNGTLDTNPRQPFELPKSPCIPSLLSLSSPPLFPSSTLYLSYLTCHYCSCLLISQKIYGAPRSHSIFPLCQLRWTDYRYWNSYCINFIIRFLFL